MSCACKRLSKAQFQCVGMKSRLCTLPCKERCPIRMGGTTLVAAPWASGCAQFCGAPFVRLSTKIACVGRRRG